MKYMKTKKSSHRKTYTKSGWISDRNKHNVKISDWNIRETSTCVCHRLEKNSHEEHMQYRHVLHLYLFLVFPLFHSIFLLLLHIMEYGWSTSIGLCFWIGFIHVEKKIKHADFHFTLFDTSFFVAFYFLSLMPRILRSTCVRICSKDPSFALHSYEHTFKQT